jgi:hypothetical protein
MPILLATGDIAPDRPNADECFAGTRDLLTDADLVFGQLETNCAEQGSRPPQARHAVLTAPDAARPRRIRITGHAATATAMVSGHCLAERAAIARERAELVTEALMRLGVDQRRVETRWQARSQPAPVRGADGLAEPSRRRVDIEVLDSEATAAEERR